jgi:Ca-activated chloride channel family protein
MTFLAPELLFGLLLIPLAIGFYLWAQRRRSGYAVRFTNLDLLANIAPRRPAWRRHVPPAFYLAAVAALVLGLARPTMVVAVPREDATVVLAMDVSGSMKATDVAPSRLSAAREAARSFIDQLPAGVRVGIVAFASRPVTLVQPTTDRTQLDAALDGLQALDGTAMGDALMQVLDLAEVIQAGGAAATGDAATGDAGTADGATPSPSADPSSAPDSAVDQPTGEPVVAAILLSDGANSVGDTEPLAAAERGASLGVPIYTIALGTAEGQVQVRDETGQPVIIDVPPDRTTLAQIAEITGGTAFDAPTAAELSAVYDNLQSRVGFTNEEQEITSWFAAGALVLVVVAAGLSAVWFGRLP